ncbi:MAG: hypothetical protein IJ877_07405 [Candidatus Gastranaerophilales bacterium]|nr:hypothetical protein [Candidatus Gastranaerophilales bacterium]
MLTKFDDIFNIEIESNPLREYKDFKNENLDYIVMFQIGSFFETFFEDAEIFSEVTGSALGSRNFKGKINIIESGVPKNSLNSYIKILLNNGLKVCICSEFIDENGGHYRAITRKYTKGTVVESEFLESAENNYLMAINCKNNTYNISYADCSTGQFYKTLGDFRQCRNELEKISPKEVLIPKNQEKLFKDIILKYNTTILDDNYFEEKIEDVIDKYCKNTQINFKSKLDKIVEYKCESFMALDEITRKNLEFTRTSYLQKKRGSFFWFLNYTKTAMGMRLLKKYLNEPLLSIEKITLRQKAVEELVCNPDLINKIQEVLVKIGDLSRACAKLSNATISPRDLLNLVKSASFLKDLKEILSPLKSEIFKINDIKLNKIIKLSNIINSALKQDCPAELKTGGIINSGFDVELDFLNEELQNLYKEIQNYETAQKKALNLDKLHINSSPAIGYYIELPKENDLKAPKEYLKKNSTSKCTRYTTSVLKELEQSITAKRYKIYEIEFQLYQKIRLYAGDFVDLIRQLAKGIAIVDVITAFAKGAVENNLSKPEFLGNDITIKEGYHPSLLKLNNEIVKNDTDLKANSIIILTGANMSGKSTYLKHNAIIVVMAQIGAFVPASKAVLPIIDKVFFRQSTPDDIINNNSSFMLEMNDLKFILDNATDKSYILLDEPAKSTAEKEGGEIAKAFCEYILTKYKTRAMIATHNLELTKLEEKYPNTVTNYVVGGSDKANVLDRKIRRGTAKQSFAINTALLAQLPKEMMEFLPACL